VREDLPQLLPLICPRCRTVSERGRELHTVSVEQALVRDARGEIVEGILRCDNRLCRRAYPIVDGIPILVADLAGFLRGSLAQVVERELHPETAALLALGGADSDPYPHLVEHVSIYLDAHWGDRAEPPPDWPGPRFGMEGLAARLRARAALRVERTVELGASVGRGVAELAAGSAITVGVDLHFGALRRARRLLRGEPLHYPRKQGGAPLLDGDRARRRSRGAGRGAGLRRRARSAARAVELRSRGGDQPARLGALAAAAPVGDRRAVPSRRRG